MFVGSALLLLGALLVAAALAMQYRLALRWPIQLLPLVGILLLGCGGLTSTGAVLDVTEPNPLAQAPASPRLYARFSRRFWALAIDSAVYGASAILLMVLLETMRGARGGVGSAFLIWLGFLCLYEPVLVWQRGATLGHMAANIRVVDLRTGGNPGFLRAFARFWLKGIVGLLAFAFMGTTRRHQALHDLAARTTVEINDQTKALPSHFVEERAPTPTAGLPSRLRRVVVILAYLVVSWLAFGVSLVMTQSAQCFERTSACTPQERLLENVFSLLFVGALSACIILGWTGRLLGARRTHRIAPTTPAGAA